MIATGSDPDTPESCRIGVVSDTHAYLAPAVLDLLAGVDLILHAGDIGDPAILDKLRAVAPVVAVSGNLDGDEFADLHSQAMGDVAGVRFALGHKRKRLAKRLAGSHDAPLDLVVFGHDHVPSASWVEGTLWVNPGSASAPYEEDEVPTIAIVERVPTGLGVRFIPLGRREPATAPNTPKPGRK
jgi:putative phosphoesterase